MLPSKMREHRRRPVFSLRSLAASSVFLCVLSIVGHTTSLYRLRNVESAVIQENGIIAKEGWIQNRLRSQEEHLNDPTPDATFPFIFGAGQGTTGTHTIHRELAKLGLSSVHWYEVLNPNASNPKLELGVKANKAFVRHYQDMKACISQLTNCTTLDAATVFNEMTALIDLVMDSGMGAINDAPYTSWASYIIARAQRQFGKTRGVMVVLSTRGPLEWARRRVEKKGTDLVGPAFRNAVLYGGPSSEFHRIPGLALEYNHPHPGGSSSMHNSFFFMNEFKNDNRTRHGETHADRMIAALEEAYKRYEESMSLFSDYTINMFEEKKSKWEVEMKINRRIQTISRKIWTDARKRAVQK